MTERMSKNSSKPTPIADAFHWFAHSAARVMGSVWAFAAAVTVIVLWSLSGPIFGFSDTWQLVINTSTTIVTFLMVFLIQNTQNRDGRAFHLKLDELLRAVTKARTDLVDLEDLSEAELDRLQTEFEQLRRNRERTKSNHRAPSKAKRRVS